MPDLAVPAMGFEAFEDRHHVLKRGLAVLGREVVPPVFLNM